MKLKLLLFLFLVGVSVGPSYSQKNNKKIIITGYIVDVNQHPIIDAIVMINNKNTNITTDRKGFFKVKVKQDATTIGIITLTNGILEEAINGRTRINFAFADLVPNHKRIQNKTAGEEEINVGYGTVKRKNLLSPVSKIDGTNKRYASYHSIYEMLSGEVPGVQVVGNSIQIRGVSSFMLSSEPLFVVDGIVVSSIENIPPQMVRSIEVIKGPSASIYGSRGTNGMILINLLDSNR